MQTLEHYRELFEAYLKDHIPRKEPRHLYEPMAYILALGGKRLRPVLTLAATGAMGGDPKEALPAALALELFHNFSLLHDDIMDDAPLRRGKTTVHEKWDVNTGILSGDALLIKAYQCFGGYEAMLYQPLVKLFSQTALEVCEGQQFDMDFESREQVSLQEYMHMISLKTAVLLGACMQSGAIVAGAGESSQKASHEFGTSLGIAFQLQDDYLDAFGDPALFGKQTGGDIIENKKTFLYLKTLELAGADDTRELEQWYSIKPADSSSKVETVKGLFQKTGADEQLRNEIRKYTDKAFECLQQMKVSEEARQLLRRFGETLMHRTF